jgi:hypothetical protein
VTLAELWIRYREEYAAGKKKSHTVRDNDEWWERDLNPALGATRITNINGRCRRAA